MIDLSGENADEPSVISNDETNSFKYKVFVHVFDQCTQDSETIVAILNDVLFRIKEPDPQTKKGFHSIRQRRMLSFGKCIGIR